MSENSRRAPEISALVGLLCLASLLAGVLAAGPAHAQDPARLRADVEYLASEALEGRASGTPGADAALAHIAAKMKAIGLEPAGTDGYLMPMQAATHVGAGPTASLRIGERVLAAGVEYRPAGFSDDVAFDDEVVFAGYGLSMPALGYDDYAGLDVQKRVVLVFSGAPAHLDAGLEPIHHHQLSSEAKAALALAMGARALLIVNAPSHHGSNAGQRPDALYAMRPALALQGIGVAHLTARAAHSLFPTTDNKLEELQASIDAAQRPASRPLAIRAQGTLDVQRRITTIYNVVGKLPTKAKSSGAPVILGAHYDGLGHGHYGSFSTAGHEIHPGADDNASGIAVLLETARQLSARPPKKGFAPIYFVALAGEEIGLRGARHMAHHLRTQSAPADAIFVNMDMVGRLRPEGLNAATSQADTSLHTLLHATANRHRLALLLEPLHARHSDHTAFFEAGFTALNLTTGRHGDYHMPTDTIERINWAGLTAVARFVEALVRALAAGL
ncbi:MAG: M20/M25/M40 family metallo-hydrolase [Bradymonadaceae bacterium]|nr:M20/M25/M40 family metallo-hydrolase [Lujinxingiaceae bacterium]